MNLVLGMMYMIFPMFWLSMLSWIGLKIGDMAQSLSKGASMPQEAGQQGGGLAKDAATTAVTKGIK